MALVQITIGFLPNNRLSRHAGLVGLLGSVVARFDATIMFASSGHCCCSVGWSVLGWAPLSADVFTLPAVEFSHPSHPLLFRVLVVCRRLLSCSW